MFDHSYFQNNHSQSQNRRFKEFAHFRRKIPATKRPFAWGGGVETLSGRMPFEHAYFLRGASLTGTWLLVHWQEGYRLQKYTFMKFHMLQRKSSKVVTLQNYITFLGRT